MPSISFKKVFLLASVLLVLGALFSFAYPAGAIDLIVNIPGPGGEVEKVKDLCEYIRAWYNFFLGIVGILAVFMIVIGGVQWLFAAGNSGRIGKAKETIVAAVLGMLLAFVSYGLLYIINPDLVQCGKPKGEGTGGSAVKEEEIGLPRVVISGRVLPSGAPPVARSVEIRPKIVCDVLSGSVTGSSLNEMSPIGSQYALNVPVRTDFISGFQGNLCESPVGMFIGIVEYNLSGGDEVGGGLTWEPGQTYQLGSDCALIHSGATSGPDWKPGSPLRDKLIKGTGSQPVPREIRDCLIET